VDVAVGEVVKKMGGKTKRLKYFLSEKFLPLLSECIDRGDR
jgi:hypothetical protein